MSFTTNLVRREFLEDLKLGGGGVAQDQQVEDRGGRSC